MLRTLRERDPRCEASTRTSVLADRAVATRYLEQCLQEQGFVRNPDLVRKHAAPSEKQGERRSSTITSHHLCLGCEYDCPKRYLTCYGSWMVPEEPQARLGLCMGRASIAGPVYGLTFLCLTPAWRDCRVRSERMKVRGESWASLG